tara:strand:- start:15760 stop:16155 length:396 start_codon:yes stop_codon:yes gene_type:complete
MKKILSVLLVVLSFSALTQNIGLQTISYSEVNRGTEEVLNIRKLSSGFIIKPKENKIVCTHSNGHFLLTIVDTKSTTVENEDYQTMYVCTDPQGTKVVLVTYAKPGQDIYSVVVFEIGSEICTDIVVKQIF